MSRPNRTMELIAAVQKPGTCARSTDLAKTFGYKVLREARAGGLVVEILPRVFAHALNAGDFGTRIAALSLWLPNDCVVTGLAALHLLELAESAPSAITIAAPRDQHLAGPAWLRVLRTGLVRTREFRSGVMCAARERAVIDAWMEAPQRDQISVVLEAMRRCNMKGSAVTRELAKMPRVRGRRELNRLLQYATDGIQSFLEHRVRRTVLNTPDFRCLRRQVEVTAMGATYTLDTYHEASRTVIECDGANVHGTYAAKKRDNARDAALATLDMLTLRIGYDDAMQRPLHCRDVIRRTIAARLMRAGGAILSANAL